MMSGGFKPLSLAYAMDMGPTYHMWAEASMPWKRLAHESFPCTDRWPSSLKASPLLPTQQAHSHELAVFG